MTRIWRGPVQRNVLGLFRLKRTQLTTVQIYSALTQHAECSVYRALKALHAQGALGRSPASRGGASKHVTWWPGERFRAVVTRDWPPPPARGSRGKRIGIYADHV